MTADARYGALQLFVDGRWLDAGDRVTEDVINPATGEAIAALPHASRADIDAAAEAAGRAFRPWKTLPAYDRAKIIRKAADLLRERVEHIATRVVLEQGKPMLEARQEVLAAADIFDWTADEGRRTYGRIVPSRMPGARWLVTKEPVGPVAAFAPWNFPIHNPGRKLGAPIAAGCSVILKPAEEAPASAMAVVTALVDAGLPAGVCQLVFGVPDEVSRHLLASPVIRKCSFTGSTIVGKHLMKLAADNALRTTMELGGHAPVIVFDDCNVERTLDMLTLAKARNAGQVCVSPTRFYIQDAIHDRFVSALTERFGALRLGNGLDPATQMGPMANARRPDAIDALVADATARGGRLLTGGERIGNEGYFYRPTVISDLPLDARIMNEEPFGRVIATARFSTFDEAVEQANRLPFGLAAYAFTENGRQANRIGAALEAGMVGINVTRMAYADAPFQGVKHSGHGSEDGPEGLAACLVTKSIHQQ